MEHTKRIPEINGKHLAAYGARMLEYSVGEVEYKNGFFRPPRSVFPVSLKPDIGLRPVSITLDVEGPGQYQIMKRISDMTAELQRGAVLFLPDGFFYTCMYEGHSAPQEMAPWILQVKYDFQAVRHGGLHSIELEPGAGSKLVFIEGNHSTPVIYTFTPKAAGSVSIGGIKISSLRAGVEVVIDGIKKTIKAGGSNIFASADMTEFPTLEYGENTLTVVGDIAVRVDYYPIYM